MIMHARPRLPGLLAAGLLGCATLAAAQLPTTTSTTVASSTTTTIPANGCDDTIPGTLAATRCRLDALAAEIGGTAVLGAYQTKLGKTLDRAIPLAAQAETACASGDTKTASRRMKQAQTLLQKMAHRLSGLSARKKLDGGIRAQLIQAIGDVRSDVSALRRKPCGPV